MESPQSKTSSCESSSSGREIFSHHGVILMPSSINKDDNAVHNLRDEDIQYVGILSIVSYNTGKYIEWKPSEESVVTECIEPEWAMVNTTAYRARTLSGSTDTSLTRLLTVRIPVDDLRSLKVYDKKTKFLLVHKDKKEHKFFFEFQNADCFLSALRSVVRLKRSQEDKHVYYIIDNTNALVDPFSELSLFHENHRDTVWKYINNFKKRPYETTLSTFSKFTEYLLYRSPEWRPIEEDVVHMFNRPASIMPSASQDATEEGYHVVMERSERHHSQLPPRIIVPRSYPLNTSQWTSFLDSEGRVTDEESIKKIIFEGGITPAIRTEVWKFLLGYYPWNSTSVERQELKKVKVEEYFKMKLQWRSMSREQESRFSDYRDRKNLIEKDVNRTDRTLKFFSGDNNPNLALLYDILMTYAMYNFDLGYVQGMSDLLSPILTQMSNEVDAFWCFVGFMDKVYRNFDVDQSGMKKQLSQLHTLLTAVEPELAAYLDEHDSGNMFFCFRWLLVWFKREFSHNEIMTLWEVLWTGKPCTNFHLLICVAILDNEKSILLDRHYGFTEILKHINDLSLKISLDDVLTKAIAIYEQLKSSETLTTSTKRVIGLEINDNNGASTSSEDDSIDENDCDNAPSDESAAIISTSLESELERNCDKGIMFHM